MLVLTQKYGDFTELVVPPSSTPTVIRKTVFKIGPYTVRDGWEAPREVSIVRGSLLDVKPPTKLGEGND